MTTIDILNPVAAIARREAAAAPRPKYLDQKRLGLFWNNKTGGNVALRHAAQRLRERHPSITVREYQGSVGSSTRYMTPGDRAQIKAECDVVIGSTADCGSCTSWLINDMVQLEKLGIPTVAFTSSHFEKDARTTGDIVGLASVPLAIVPETFTSHTEDEIRAMVDGTIDSIVRSLTTAPAAIHRDDDAFAAIESFSGRDQFACLDDFNRTALDRGWSDGFPLIPPTPEAVDRMLAVSPLPRDTVIAEALYPGLGVATLEKIAINGVMAGCRPEHLPVLVALVRAYVGTGAMGKTQAMSTGPNAPIVMISGPIIEKLGLNYTTCALGPGSRSYVNTVIGRALRLILMNIGQAYPGQMDMDTIGTPNKYSFCVAENAGKSPWAPWNVHKGFGEDESTLSIALVYPGPDILDMVATTPEQFLDTLVSLTANFRGTGSIGRWLYGGRAEPETGEPILEKNILLLAPDHARLMRDHKWSRADIGNYLYKHSRMAFEKICLQSVRDKPVALKKAFPQFMWLLDNPDVLVPTSESPDCYETFVVGGDVGRSQYFFGGSEVSTVRIDDWPAK
ncbi:MAG TPA: hypothetical protein PKA33_15620 [Amaricoccus sp.]|uniref:UGSC family (seleno)protein n=1 Tax=Amaricoccus sp. TaxID=1872485 RepID=UPI002BFE9801|nr:hypothetical protein [Amaricoccus sp.]HMR34229.1 hypothetical protein [Geminicoccus sp.]HMU00777.1 hypothetical protein [Amaricoccus sp.]